MVFYYKEKWGTDMDNNMEYRQQLVERYKQAAMPLLRYLPWMEKSAGSRASSTYSGDGVGEHSISFPVYDSTLMSFVKEAEKSPFMDKNYRYVYTRNRIQTHEDELRLIANADLYKWDLLCGILSKYVMGGRTKSALWSEAVQEGIFVAVLSQMRKILEYWDRPIDVR